MYRLVMLNNQWCGCEINYKYAIEHRSIEMYVEKGHPVILSDTMEDAIDLLCVDNIKGV